jgi:tetratricopeptide (TPR) repeat protein
MNLSEWTAGDDNVARLLGQPYDPPTVPAAFAQRVQTRLLEIAAETARQRASQPRWRFRQRVSALAGMAALLGIVALGLCFAPRPVAPSAALPTVRDQRLTAAPNPTAPHALTLAPGERIATSRGERRRVALADGSVLSLNENTLVHHDAARHLSLESGEIFVEVAPRRAGKAASLFTVATPHREVSAVGTKFLVRAGGDGTGVAVTQGQVHVSDWDGLLVAGQQLAPKADTVTPTPRLSYLLDWTRDLVAVDSPQLVPPSIHSGGALVAVDPQGHAANLSLRKYHIDVHIEDGFARTTIDQTYFNHTFGRMEGTFFFPLPTDASLSRLAMYVDGQLMEGGMVERDYGRIVFEQIVTKMKDPALLEWVDGHTFKMRVFPLEARQEKRIILSYTQRLPNLYGRLSYRFPAGHSLGAVKGWSFHARVKDGAKLRWRCDSHQLTRSMEDKNDLLLDANGKQVTMERDLVLDLTEQNGVDAVRYATMTQDGYRYLMLRYRPKLPGTAKRQRRDWVFLFESSAERDPLLARTQIEIIRTLLANAERDDTFAVLSAATQVQRFAPSPQPVTPENVGAALAFLEKSHLLGALDLDAALTAAAELLRVSENPVLVHLGCGQAVLGERRADVLAGRIPRNACYVGVGVGKHWSQDFMRRAAERCQGYVTEINPDEAVAWRAFDLLATLNTPRLTGVRVADSEDKVRFLCPTAIMAQGEELCAIARLPADAPLPQSVRITGTLDSRPFREVLDIESPRPDSAYLPRTWARLEIDRLLAEDAAKNKEAIIALSKAMYVMTPYTSLLVLENEAMYAQYKVDRGRKDHWAMYACPAKIAVVSEWPLIASPYNIQLEAPSIARTARTVQSDAQLQERIRQENRERRLNPYINILRAGTPTANETEPQTARNHREEARGSALQNRRAMIEEADWERERMLDPERIRQHELARELDRARVSPPLSDIWSGRSLNALLRHLSAQQEQGVRGPNVPLSEGTLGHINLLVGDSRVNTVLLKHNGNLQWPSPLQGDPFADGRAKLTARMKTAFDRVKSGHTADDATLRDLRSDLDKMQAALNGDVDRLKADEYLESIRYLRSLKDTIAALGDANVVHWIANKETVKAKNVDDLVRFLRERRLRFAPATPGDHAAYLALHRALTAYDAGMPRTPLPPIRRNEDDVTIADNADPEGAERLLAALLADPAKAKQPSLWRRAAHIAERRKQYDSARLRLRRALELDRNRPRDLAALRRDFAWFLHLAQQCVGELSAQQRSVPHELLDEVMGIADQWRAVDPMDVEPCELAGRLFRRAGERELAWSYVTSPADLQRGSAADWLELALRQHGQKEYAFAERAFAVAASLDPGNAEIVRERALNHRAARGAERE